MEQDTDGFPSSPHSKENLPPAPELTAEQLRRNYREIYTKAVQLLKEGRVPVDSPSDDDVFSFTSKQIKRGSKFHSLAIEAKVERPSPDAPVEMPDTPERIELDILSSPEGNRENVEISPFVLTDMTREEFLQAFPLPERRTGRRHASWLYDGLPESTRLPVLSQPDGIQASRTDRSIAKYVFDRIPTPPANTGQ